LYFANNSLISDKNFNKFEHNFTQLASLQIIE